MEKFSADYWNEQYLQKSTGWDIGYVSTPIKEYIDQITETDMKILVPGAGNAYEVEYLFRQGFKNTWLLDFSEKSIRNFTERCPEFPRSQIVICDFFKHDGQYDLIIEQTFFSAIQPKQRQKFTKQISSLLKPGGKMVGLLFGHEFEFEGPPFGGTKEEYINLFSDKFIIDKMEPAHNSIAPRKGRELFIQLRKKIS